MINETQQEVEARHRFNARNERANLSQRGRYPEDVASDAARCCVDYVWLEVPPLFKKREDDARKLTRITVAIRDGLPQRKA